MPAQTPVADNEEALRHPPMTCQCGGNALSELGLLDCIPDRAWLKDAGGRYMAVNRAVANALERTKCSVLGLTDDDLYPPNVAAACRLRDAQASAQDRPVTSEELVVGPDGVARWFETIVTAVHDSAHVVIGTSGIAREISARKVADAQRLASEARLRAIFDESPLGIGLADPNGFIIDANAAYQRMTGYTARELRDVRFSDLSTPEEARENSSLFRELVEGRRGSYTVEKTYLPKTGEPLRVRVTSAAVRDEQGRLEYSVGMVEDVTEIRHAEALWREREGQFRQAQKMDAIGRLAGGVAHDFNNLLTVIIAHAEFLQRGGPDAPAWSDDIMQIAAAAHRASALTRQLLAFGRKQVLLPQALEVHEVILGLAPLLQRSIGEDITLELTLGDLLPAVHADPGQLEQVIVNLVANARDAMPRGGTLAVSTRLAHPGDDVHLRSTDEIPAGFLVALSVSDSGVGMDELTASRIFEPFFTTKDPAHGTGLGLSTVYGIVTQSGGAIAVDTQLGRGTTITVYLPIAKAADHKPALVPAIAFDPAPSAEKILLVEDDPAVRRLAQRILTGHGYEVIEAAGGQEALRWLSKPSSPISLLLTDVVMPEMNGRELGAAVLRMQPDARVLYMSGYAGDEVFQRGVLTSDTSFLPKPFTAAALLAAVRNQLDGLKG